MFYYISQDPSIATSMPVLDLVDSIKPKSVNYDLVESGTDEEVSQITLFLRIYLKSVEPLIEKKILMKKIS